MSSKHVNDGKSDESLLVYIFHFALSIITPNVRDNLQRRSGAGVRFIVLLDGHLS